MVFFQFNHRVFVLVSVLLVVLSVILTKRISSIALSRTYVFQGTGVEEGEELLDDLELGKVGRFLLRKRPQSHFHLLVAYKQQSVSPTDLQLSLGTGLINIRDKRGRMFFTGRGKAKSVRAGAGKGSKSQGWAHMAKGEKNILLQ